MSEGVWKEAIRNKIFLKRGSFKVGGKGTGVYCVAQTVQHEEMHLKVEEFKGSGKEDNDPRGPSLTPGDGIPDQEEKDGFGGIVTSPWDIDTYRMQYREDASGDESIRTFIAEEKLTKPVIREKDWANPGCQSAQKCGVENWEAKE